MFAQQRTFTLKTGDVITGELLSINDSTKVMYIRTRYGNIQVNSNDLIEETVQIILKSGDILKGQIVDRGIETTTLETSHGLIVIRTENIQNLTYGIQNQKMAKLKQMFRFSSSNDRQIDVFTDPTGYILDEGTLYMSGLSWGLGATEKIQITSRWPDYIWGDINFRTKVQIFKTGNIAKESALSVGVDFHTRTQLYRYTWHEKELVADVGYIEYDHGESAWVHESYKKVYYSDYSRLGSTYSLNNYPRDYWSKGQDTLRYSSGSFSGYMSKSSFDFSHKYEAFIAYTISLAKVDGMGRNSFTLGAYYGQLSESGDCYARVYFAGSMDISRELIFNYEVFYDPTYVGWQRQSRVTKDEFSFFPIQHNQTDYEILHADIGFIYAYSDWLRLGIHYQPYVGLIYFKL